jgi:hypothetical protein
VTAHPRGADAIEEDDHRQRLPRPCRPVEIEAQGELADPAILDITPHLQARLGGRRQHELLGGGSGDGSKTEEQRETEAHPCYAHRRTAPPVDIIPGAQPSTLPAGRSCESSLRSSSWRLTK